MLARRLAWPKAVAGPNLIAKSIKDCVRYASEHDHSRISKSQKHTKVHATVGGHAPTQQTPMCQTLPLMPAQVSTAAGGNNFSSSVHCCDQGNTSEHPRQLANASIPPPQQEQPH